MHTENALVHEQRKRILSQLRSERALLSLYPQVDTVVRRFLLRTLQKPEELMDHIKT